MAGLGMLGDQGVDLVLGLAVVALALADIDALGIAAHEIEHRRADQIVIDHHLGALDQAERAQGQQIRIAGAGADDGDASLSALRSPARPFTRVSMRSRAPGFIAGQQLCRRPGRRKNGPRSGNALAASGSRRPHRRGGSCSANSARRPRRAGSSALDRLAHAAGQHGRRAAGGDADDDGIALDDGGNDEAGKLGAVGDVHRHAGGAGRLGHALVHSLAAGGGEHDARGR